MHFSLTEVMALVSSLVALIGSVSSLYAVARKSRREDTVMRAKLESLSDQIIHKSLSVAREQVSHMEGEISELYKERDILIATNRELQKTVDQLMEENRRLKQEVARLRDEVAALKQRVGAIEQNGKETH